jgi:hypothetical protein
MKNILLLIFTWWNGATVGTLFHTWRKGELVGQDEAGNRYYQTKGGIKDPALGIVRRWVIYKGDAEASRIPQGWYGWMHTSSKSRPRMRIIPRTSGNCPTKQMRPGHRMRGVHRDPF